MEADETGQRTIYEEDAGVLYADKCIRTLGEYFIKIGGKIRERTKVSKISNVDSGKIKFIDYFESEFVFDGLVIAAGPWSSKLLEDTGVSVPAVPNRVDVLYWKVKEEYKQVYNINNFPSGLKFVEESHDQNGHNQAAVYWTPQWEYPDMFKIGYHGKAINSSHPDTRDRNIQEDLQRNIKGLYLPSRHKH